MLSTLARLEHTFTCTAEQLQAILKKVSATDTYKAPALEYKFELRFMYYLADSSHSTACSTEIRIKQIALILTRSPAKSS